jgi:hypothetical protein
MISQPRVPRGYCALVGDSQAKDTSDETPLARQGQSTIANLPRYSSSELHRPIVTEIAIFFLSVL